MSIFETFQQVSMWGDSFKVEDGLNSNASPISLVNTSKERKPEYIPQESKGPSGDDHQDTNKAVTKVLRRLAQNREAARKSRLRKKAYVQQLETSRLKLMQLELELENARKQGVYVGGGLDASYIGPSGTINPGIAAFEIEYGHWVEEQHRHNKELRSALQTQAPDIQLDLLVKSYLNHYSTLFRMKADAARADVFYLLSGVWKTSVERIFLWIGGSRPSELLNIVVPQLQPLTDGQILGFNNLRQSSQQAEDALSQGLDKLQQSLVYNIAADPMDMGNFGFQMAAAVEKIEAVEGFVNQADHLREQTLQQMSRILTPHQAARGLVALGEYFHRLRALSSLWAARPCDPS
ncbi:hypothetical protein L6164_030540 [Bauhinia variegata]|uniref:Uncharacterized protein n=1 Tax=Bauhinia variegata TaxID=167791 RepID=A0ACB9LCN3_BAUVA|nr:hypothetical protein L6164_030540 [Bauhinia variegata]